MTAKFLTAVASLSLLIATAATRPAAAQAAPKMGHIHTKDLLADMPEMKKADTAILTLARQYQNDLETMQKELQKKYTEYTQGAATMTDVMKENRQRELQELDNRMQQTQQSADDKVKKRQEELYRPILDKAEKAIKDVAKEKAYDYIFDSSLGALLYFKESDDIMPLVKAKLGIK